MPADPETASLANDLISEIEGKYEDATGTYNHPRTLKSNYVLVTIRPLVGKLLTTGLDRWSTLDENQRTGVQNLCVAVWLDFRKTKEHHRLVRRGELDAITDGNSGSDCIILPAPVYLTQMVPITIPRIKAALQLLSGGIRNGEHQSALTSPAAEKMTEPVLNECEKCIVEALAHDRLTGERIAKKAGYPFNSNFKKTLSGLVKQGRLTNINERGNRGYEVVRSLSGQLSGLTRER